MLVVAGGGNSLLLQSPAQNNIRLAPLLPPQLTTHVLMVVPAAAIGIICGICAIIFTLINLKVRWGLIPFVYLQLPCVSAASAGTHQHVALRERVLADVRASAVCPALANCQPANCRVPQVARARQEFFKGKPAK